MSNIKLIEKDTDINSLKITRYDWDVVINGRPFYVVRIPGYVHTIGGKYGENDLWAYPREQNPSYENLVEFCCDEPVCWGIKYEPDIYLRCKWDECEARNVGCVYITRNGEIFCDVAPSINYGIDKARVMITHFKEHPINFQEIDFDKKVIGRKVWWRSEPAIVRSYINGQACVILEPDGIEHFSVPAEFRGDDPEYYEDDWVKVDVLDKHIWWFRE